MLKRQPENAQCPTPIRKFVNKKIAKNAFQAAFAVTINKLRQPENANCPEPIRNPVNKKIAKSSFQAAFGDGFNI
jgi:hypothetical protein